MTPEENGRYWMAFSLIIALAAFFEAWLKPGWAVAFLVLSGILAWMAHRASHEVHSELPAAHPDAPKK